MGGINEIVLFLPLRKDFGCSFINSMSLIVINRFTHIYLQTSMGHIY